MARRAGKSRKGAAQGQGAAVNGAAVNGAAAAVEPRKAAGLRYVDDGGKGISRERSGKSFTYVGPTGRAVRDRRVLERIRSLAIPPAWIEIWICPDAKGHLQATGRDARGRKQYRYHPLWREARNEDKYQRVIAFAEALPRVRKRVARHLQTRGLSREKVLAAVVKLLETTLIRVGNDEYAESNQSFGLTTLRDRHADVNGTKVCFAFRGKSKIGHEIDLRDPRLAQIVQQCQDLPGQELFQYVNGDETVHDVTSERLGNTTAICRKCYVHPAIIDAHMDRSLVKLLKERTEKELRGSLKALPAEEAAVLALLQQRMEMELGSAKRKRRSKEPRNRRMTRKGERTKPRMKHR